MSHWIENRLFDITDRNMNLLIEHKVPALIAKNFIPQDICEVVASRLEQTSFQNYDHLNNIPVFQIGLCHNQWAKDDFSVYFGKKQEALKIVEDIYQGLDIDPVQKVIDMLSLKCNRQVQLFHEPGFGDYFAGAFRSFKGHGKLHVDHAPSHISAPWAVTSISKQLTWNIYYSVKHGAGELVIYDTIHTPENEKQKTPNDYYFPYSVLENTQHIRIKPEVGDLILFNTQNFHEILSDEQTSRISQTSFIGLKEDGSLNLWS